MGQLCMLGSRYPMPFEAVFVMSFEKGKVKMGLETADFTVACDNFTHSGPTYCSGRLGKNIVKKQISRSFCSYRQQIEDMVEQKVVEIIPSYKGYLFSDSLD